MNISINYNFIFEFFSLKSLILIFLLFQSCSSKEEDPIKKSSRNQKGEYIYRRHQDSLLAISPPEKQAPKNYPWERGERGKPSKITKEFFRCKGNSLNPCYTIQRAGESLRCDDCAGIEKHSLPLREGKEFIFPILLEICNYIQEKTGMRIVITSGHRCPEHNTYVDPSTENQYSKHLIGGEVSFYVQGLESKPEVILNWIFQFYREEPRYFGDKEYQEFKRYEKGDTNVSTFPWYNKEVFVKLFKKDEGRNFDNRHPYPYLSIQVRYDRDLEERVIYTWEKAHKNYHRR